MRSAPLDTSHKRYRAGTDDTDRYGEDTSDQSDEGSEDEEEQDLTIRTQLNSIIADFISRELEVETLKKDSERSKSLSQQTNDKGKNLLHLIADGYPDSLEPGGYRYTEGCSLQPLVLHLIEKHKNLVQQEDTLQMTPLRTAIRNGEHTLVEDMCSDGNYKALSNALKQQNFEGNNCLHEALLRTNKKHGTKIAKQLVKCLKNVDNRPSVTALNRNHKTPLHIAVEWQHCTKFQFKIVRDLVNACPETLGINLCDDNKEKLSVYRYHEMTRQNAKPVAESKETNSTQMSSNGTPLGDPKTKDALSDRSEAQQALKVPGQSDLTPKNHLSRTGTKKMTQEGQESSLTVSIQRQSTRQNISLPVVPLNEPKLGNESLLLATTTKQRQNKKSTELPRHSKEVSETAADKIRDFLKFCYMKAEKDHEKLVSYLYGPVQGMCLNVMANEQRLSAMSEKQICWALAEGPLSVGVRQLRSMDFLQFEDTLKYVLLPRVEVAKRKYPAQQETSGPNVKGGTGRDDYMQIFRWLYEKGVRRVCDLYIDDLKEPSHSDETIEQALLDIEVLSVWDWRRFDLSSEVISRAAPKVTHACLYWSGNNAVLRGWSEPDGLSQLKHLEKISLYRRQGLETLTRENENLAAFSTRLNFNRKTLNHPAVTIQYDPLYLQSAEVAKIPEDSPEQQVDEHKWLTCMDNFATYAHNISQEYEPYLGEDKKPRHIRVALIDDGFDISNQSLHEKVLGGRSFCVKDGLNAPYWATNRSHGTLMASLICRVCPMARLYVLRLDEHSTNDRNRRQITAKSAQLAVRAAISKGVDIISMSWTIEETSSNQDDIEGLEKALKEAADHNILLFCSSDDEATGSNSSHPSHDTTRFKIGAATAYGKASHFTHSETVDYIFPGDHVIKERHDSVINTKGSPVSGSSVATALAAGLAALTLWIVQFSVQYDPAKPQKAEVMAEEKINLLRQHQQMNRVFDAMGVKDKYVEVWPVFESACKDMKNKEMRIRKDIVRDIARKITVKLPH